MTTNMTPLEDAIQDRDLPEIQRILSSISAPSQDELDMALEMAVESDQHGGYIDALEPLLAAGANITESAFVGASHRDDNLVYQAFLDHGWDINSMEFGQPALRFVHPPGVSQAKTEFKCPKVLQPTTLTESSGFSLTELIATCVAQKRQYGYATCNSCLSRRYSCS